MTVLQLKKWPSTARFFTLSVLSAVVVWFVWGHDLSYEHYTLVNGVKVGEHLDEFDTGPQIVFTIVAGMIAGGLLTWLMRYIVPRGR
jgi:hypothetical protein